MQRFNFPQRKQKYHNRNAAYYNVLLNVWHSIWITENKEVRHSGQQLLALLWKRFLHFKINWGVTLFTTFAPAIFLLFIIISSHKPSVSLYDFFVKFEDINLVLTFQNYRVQACLHEFHSMKHGELSWESYALTCKLYTCSPSFGLLLIIGYSHRIVSNGMKWFSLKDRKTLHNAVIDT